MRFGGCEQGKMRFHMKNEWRKKAIYYDENVEYTLSFHDKIKPVLMMQRRKVYEFGGKKRE